MSLSNSSAYAKALPLDICLFRYPGLPAERLEYWQKRATREWSLRPGPMLTFLKGMNSWEGFKSAVYEVESQTILGRDLGFLSRTTFAKSLRLFKRSVTN